MEARDSSFSSVLVVLNLDLAADGNIEITKKHNRRYHKIKINTTIIVRYGNNYKVSIIWQNGGDDYFTQTGGASDGFITLIKSLDYDYGRSVFALNVTVTVSNWNDPFRSHIFYLTVGINFKPENIISKRHDIGYQEYSSRGAKES